MPHLLNSIGHFDIAGPDAAALSAFYSGVFGWNVTPKGPGYALVETPAEGPNGAIVEAESSALTLGLVVASLSDTLAVAQAKGGTVVMEPMDNGWVRKAQIRDPAGNLLTVIEA